ncbi:hypothetical protein MINT15_09170 [Saccharomonospora viridis]|uniref:Uncharacterized protein n=1 Tax=Saccharomonospora viridis TaxID=1852 RepID=A0A837DA08_9PSEU|nr:hypothetical protein MINT15_09170 [Saccharomonospora viridis]
MLSADVVLCIGCHRSWLLIGVVCPACAPATLPAMSGAGPALRRFQGSGDQCLPSTATT